MFTEYVIQPKNREQLNKFKELADSLKVPLRRISKKEKQEEYEKMLDKSILEMKEGKVHNVDIDNLWN